MRIDILLPLELLFVNTTGQELERRVPVGNMMKVLVDIPRTLKERTVDPGQSPDPSLVEILLAAPEGEVATWTIH